MSLAEHQDGYRRIWMFPRNIRKIHPWKMSQMLPLFLNIVHSREWSGNQMAQNAFCKALEAAGLKRVGVQYDPNSGGPRTYFSQLKCLGLIFQRDDGSIYLSKAGEDLANGSPPLPIMRSMLLRHQYPSIYGASRGVRINTRLKVKPFLFVLRLLNHRDVGHMTNRELVVPIVFGHNDGSFGACIEKILKIRSGASIFDIASPEDLYLPRASEEEGLVQSNLMDIANTCKNYMQACGLIDVERDGREESILFSEDIREIYEKALERKDEFIPLKTEEQFQRAYGAWDRLKDTRSLVAPAKPAATAEERIILSRFYELCGTTIVTGIPDGFLESMRQDFGFDKEKVKDAIFPHLSRALSFYEATFLELSTGGASRATEFERAVRSLFQDRLHFHSKHTGYLRKSRGVGGYADVFAVALDERHCAILDAKASPSYTLGASDYRAMESDYIPNYRDLTDGRNLKLEFCAYVAGGFHGRIDYKLKSLEASANIGCSAIRARDLLELSAMNPSKKDQRLIRDAFRSSKVLSISDFKL